MDGRGILKKPKREIESDGEEHPNKKETNNHNYNHNHNHNHNHSSSDDDDEDASTSRYDEQEEALVALFEHRTKEVEHLNTRISYYQSQLKQAQQRLHDTETKLVHVRRKICDKKWNCHIDPKREVTKEHKSISSVNGGSSQRQPQSKPQLLIPSANQKSSRPMTVAGTDPKASPSRYDSPIKPRGDRSHGTPSRPEDTKSQAVAPVGVKRKLECKEHRELTSKVRSTSSPTMIQCYASTHISSQHKRKLRSLTLCPMIDKLFITSALDGMVHLWQIQAKGSGATLLSSTECLSPKQRRWPEDIAWHPEGNRLVAVYSADGGDNQISVLNLNKSQSTRVSFLKEKPHVKGIINSVTFMPWDDTYFATGGSDHAVVFWNDKDGGDEWKPKTLHRNLHSSAVMGVAGMQHKQMVVSAGADKRIIGYDVLAGRVDYKHQIESKCMSVLPNPCDFHLFMVQTGTPERQLRLFDIRLRNSELHAFGWKQESSESQSALINQAWSPDGLYLTSGSADPMIHVFDIRYNAHKPSQSVKAHSKRVFKAEWHPTMPLLISISSDLNIGLHKI
ncbi:hypothetical protein SOVF_149760 [Spinacia oleracea]|uniref:Anaphase-promoting complex subunit 4 WD40 domain-containing protein n=1 Tax=Spinacia oleracea TaxID=3562 RepID=A0A9R0JRT1_SPIOL|nr:uncharacterized protein LOC110784610 [Spinacia oleracea]KNA09851.1 hypothetical protein SOVF_149760 [Spinacia oleracea]